MARCCLDFLSVARESTANWRYALRNKITLMLIRPHCKIYRLPKLNYQTRDTKSVTLQNRTSATTDGSGFYELKSDTVM